MARERGREGTSVVVSFESPNELLAAVAALAEIQKASPRERRRRGVSLNGAIHRVAHLVLKAFKGHDA